MRTLTGNLGWFFREAGTIMRMSALSSAVSVLGTALVLFLFAMTLVVRLCGTTLAQTISADASMDVHPEASMPEAQWGGLIAEIRSIPGVRDVRIVTADEAKERMKGLLGSEADVLDRFEQNPFEACIEVQVGLDERTAIYDRLAQMEGVSAIRDNRAVLDRLGSLAAAARWIGWIVTAAVGITCLVLVSHVVRQGMELHRERIRTMHLLGAPALFTAVPFLLAALLLSTAGGLLAAGLAVASVRVGFSAWIATLPFLPLPERAPVIAHVLRIVPATGAALGFLGGLFGLTGAARSR